MASTYVNNLRLNEMATGDQSGTWGTTTNTNLELIGQAFAWGTRAIANASTDNITIADGASDADRSMAPKLTGGGQGNNMIYLSGGADHEITNPEIVDQVVELVEQKVRTIND